MRYIYVMLILLIIPMIGFAINPNAGEYGFQFLQIPANPVSAALAGNGIYHTNYSGAYLQNPAANLSDERFSLSVQHCLWLVDTSYSQLIYSNGNRNHHFGLAARMLDYGKLNTYDDTGLLIGNYHPLDANLTANYAFRILPDHLLGVNAGLVYEKLDTASSYGIAADLGYMFLTPITNAVLFASARNLGFTSKMDNESVKLPLTFETGIGYSYPMDSNSLAGQLTISKALDTDIRATLAAEYTLKEILKLRLGYKANYDEEGPTAGFGIKIRNLDVDYGWTYNTDRLNDTHAFGITYNF